MSRKVSDEQRVAALRSYGVLDGPSIPVIDDLVELAARICGVPIALVSLVDSDRQWFLARKGLEAPQTPRDVAFCSHAIEQVGTMQVEDATEDERFANNPLVLGDPRIRFYAGAPLVDDEGHALGTLCVIDRERRKLAAHQLQALEQLGRAVTGLLKIERLERAARAQAERLEAALEALPSGVLLLGSAGQITFANAAARTSFAHVGATLLKRPVQELLPPPQTEAIPAEDGRSLARWQAWIAEHPDEVTARRADGSSFPAQVQVCPISIRGVPANLVAVIDLTERRRVEAMKENAAQHERLVTVGTLAAGIGHEINNPLTFIAANIELALEELVALGGLSPPSIVGTVTEILGETRTGTDRIRKIVRGLRFLARDDGLAGPTDVLTVIELCVNMAMHEIRPRARLEQHLDPVPPVFADDARLSQVIVNLLVNAAQSFAIEDTADNVITLRTGTNGDKIEISVSDNGCGIPTDVRAHIFDPFFTTKPVGVGTGLGLSICRNVVTGLGGTLKCETEVGAGTTFTVSLPPAPLAAMEPPVWRHSHREKRGRVLLIDDDEAVLRSLSRLLEREHHVTALCDSEASLSLLTKSPEPFDVVFCDIMMPSIDGMELYRRVAATSPAQAERFVFITGGASYNKVRAFLADVPNERVEKPFSSQTLRGIARRYSRRHSSS